MPTSSFLRSLGGAVAVLAVACAQPAVIAPAKIPTISNAPAPEPARVASGCPDGLGWLGRATYVRYTEVADGHFGYSELHADFHRHSNGDTFEGVVTMTYRERSDSLPRATSRAMTLPHSEVTHLLTAMRDGIRTPPRPSPRGGVYVIDTSQSVMIALDAIAPDADRDLHVQFYVEGAQREPQDWHIRGCETDAPATAQRAVQEIVEAFATKLERDATIQRLMTP